MDNREMMIEAFESILILVDRGHMSIKNAKEALLKIADLRDQIAYKEGQYDTLSGVDRYDAP